MNKDVNIASRIVDEYFPQASLIRTTQRLSNEAVKEMGFNVDYTEMVRYVEKLSGVIIQSSLWIFNTNGSYWVMRCEVNHNRFDWEILMVDFLDPNENEDDRRKEIRCK